MQRIAGSPWAVLGLDEGASLDEVTHAFRARAKRSHPDVAGDRAEFEAVRAAFEAVRPLAPRRPRPCRRLTNAYGWSPAPAGETIFASPAPRIMSAAAPAARPATPPVSRSAARFAAVLDDVLA